VDEFVGTLNGKDTSGSEVRVALDADSANITAGGNGRGGDVVLSDDSGKATVWIDGGGSEGPTVGPFHITPELLSGAAQSRIRLRADTGQNAGIWVGGEGRSGDLWLLNGEGDFTVGLRALEGENAGIWIGGGGDDQKKNVTGWLTIRNKTRRDVVVLGGKAGQLRLAKSNGDVTIAMNASEGPAGEYTNLWIGGNGNDGGTVVHNNGDKRAAYIGSEATHHSGQLLLAKSNGDVTIAANAVDGEDDEAANLWVGGNGQTGWLALQNAKNNQPALLGGEDGRLELRDHEGTTMITLTAATGAGRFGGQGVNGDLLVFSGNAPDQAADHASVWIKGSTGDIVLKNADCAEEFELAPGPEVEPGTVLVIDEEGMLKPSDVPYDRAVAGVASGGGDERPGIILGHRPGDGRRLPIALSGRVYCRVDAEFAPIRVGDLLTTSANPGYAMNATDRTQAFGSVLGKALRPLLSGQALIPILVALQ
jgi:hypothetical protein